MELHDVVAKKRSNSELFLKYGFVRIVSDGIEKRQCVPCMQVCLDKPMKPTKLKRYLESKHNDYKDKCLTLLRPGIFLLSMSGGKGRFDPTLWQLITFEPITIAIPFLLR